MRQLFHTQPFHLKKRRVVLLGVLLVIIGMGSYALWSKQVWESYQPEYTLRHKTLKDAITKLAKVPAGTAEERKAVISTLEDIARQTQTFGQKTCDVQPAVAWQAKVWTNLKVMQNSCIATKLTVVKLGNSLQKVTAYTQDDNKLASLLAAVPQSSELSDDTWGAQATWWQKTGTDMERTSVSPAFTPVKKLAVAKAAAMKDAWLAISTAHQAKDKAKYLAAQNELAHALDGLNEIVVISEKELVPLADELNKTVSEVFDN